MIGIFKKIKSFRVTSVEDLNVIRKEAQDEGAFEERKYHTSPDYGNNPNALPPAFVDRTYENLFKTEPLKISLPKKETQSSKRLQRAKSRIESITGGWVVIGGNSNRIFKRTLNYEELTTLQASCYLKTQSDSHATTIVNNIEYYTIGNGIKVDCAVPQISEVIDEFRAFNKMTNREKRWVRSCFINGEMFISLIKGKKGSLKARLIPPDQIRDIEAEDDVETPLSYNRQWHDAKGGIQNKWIADYNYFEQLDSGWGVKSSHISTAKKRTNRFILHVKYAEENEPRGYPPMAVILRWLKYYENWLIDRMILNHERSKVVWIREIKGSKTKTRNNPMEAPKGGIILEEDEKTKWRIEAAKLDSRDAKADGDAILHKIGAFRNIPIHILNQDASEAVYASVKKADTPFGQMIVSNQDFFAENFKEMYRFIVECKVDAGELKDTYRVPDFDQDKVIEALKVINAGICEGKKKDEVLAAAKKAMGRVKKKSVKSVDVPCILTFPQMVNDNPLEVAKVLQIHREMGIASQATLAARAGYDWNTEFNRMLKELENGAANFGKDAGKGDAEGSGEPPEDRDHGNEPSDLPRS